MKAVTEVNEVKETLEMKRSAWMVVFAVVLMGTAAVSQAASSMNYTLLITITTDSIDISGPWADGSWAVLGGMAVNSQKHTKDIGVPTASGNWTVNNVGSSTVDINLSVTAPAQNGWSYQPNSDPGTTQPSNDMYRLSAIFTQWDRASLAYTNFNANDVLTTTPSLCSNTRFAYDTETDINFKGHTLATGQARNMFLMVEVGPKVAAVSGNITPSILLAATAH
jgi:hypothetical protein